MLKEQMYRKMKTWNTVAIVINIITVIIGIVGTAYNIILVNSPEMLSQMETLGEDVSVFQDGASTMNLLIAAVTIVVEIAVVVLMFMNSSKMKKLQEINIMPYILLLVIAAYSLISSIINLMTSDIGMNVFSIVGFVIGLLISGGPALIIILKNKKIKNIEEESKNVEEE